MVAPSKPRLAAKRDSLAYKSRPSLYLVDFNLPRSRSSKVARYSASSMEASASLINASGIFFRWSSYAILTRPHLLNRNLSFVKEWA